MSRQIRMVLMTCAGLGIASVVEAGGTPSAFDSVFSPVSYETQYVPYYTGYTPYYAGYTPYYAGYSAYYGAPYSYGYSSGSGCCQQSSYVGSGYASGPGSCAGGCASGNCSSTSSSSSSMYATPDPTMNLRSIESKLEHIERYLETHQNYSKYKSSLDDQYRNNSRGPRPNSGRLNQTPTYRDDDDNFQKPKTPGSGADSAEPFPQNTNRMDFGTDDAKSKGSPVKSVKPAPPVAPKEGALLKLDGMVTSRAVSPLRRMSLNNPSSTSVASSRGSSDSDPTAESGLPAVDVARR